MMLKKHQKYVSETAPDGTCNGKKKGAQKVNEHTEKRSETW
jgi:hypothetical protein